MTGIQPNDVEHFVNQDSVNPAVLVAANLELPSFALLKLRGQVSKPVLF